MHREGAQLFVDSATPIYWFDAAQLQSNFFGFDGTHVTLSAANGTWVWKLTGKTEQRAIRNGVQVLHEAVWPD